MDVLLGHERNQRSRRSIKQADVVMLLRAAAGTAIPRAVRGGELPLLRAALRAWQLAQPGDPRAGGRAAGRCRAGRALLSSGRRDRPRRHAWATPPVACISPRSAGCGRRRCSASAGSAPLQPGSAATRICRGVARAALSNPVARPPGPLRAPPGATDAHARRSITVSRCSSRSAAFATNCMPGTTGHAVGARTSCAGRRWIHDRA